MSLKQVEYKWVLRNDYYFYVDDFHFGHKEREYHDERGNLWFKTRGKLGIISKNYAWDGCTPKYKWGKLRIGVWDGLDTCHINHDLYDPDKIYVEDLYDCDQKMKYSSLEHDVLSQFFRQLPEHITGEDVHRHFYKKSKASGFCLSRLYYWVVKTFANRFTGGRFTR